MTLTEQKLLGALKRCEAIVSTDLGPPSWDWIRSVIADAEFPKHSEEPSIERAARVWGRPENYGYAMQANICTLIGRLIYTLEIAQTELLCANSNPGTRAEIAAAVAPLLSELQ